MDQPRETSGIGDLSTCCILSSVSGQIHQLINLAGMVPGRPTAMARGQMPSYLEETTKMQNPSMGFNRSRSVPTLSAQESFDRIGLPVVQAQCRHYSSQEEECAKASWDPLLMSCMLTQILNVGRIATQAHAEVYACP